MPFESRLCFLTRPSLNFFSRLINHRGEALMPLLSTCNRRKANRDGITTRLRAGSPSSSLSDDDDIPEAKIKRGGLTSRTKYAESSSSSQIMSSYKSKSSLDPSSPMSSWGNEKDLPQSSLIKNSGKSIVNRDRVGPISGKVSLRKRRTEREEIPSEDGQSKNSQGTESGRRAARSANIGYAESAGSSSGSSNGNFDSDDDYEISARKKKRTLAKGKLTSAVGVKKAGNRSKECNAKKVDKQMYSFDAKRDDTSIRYDDEAFRQSQEQNAAVLDDMEKCLSMSASSQSG